MKKYRIKEIISPHSGSWYLVQKKVFGLWLTIEYSNNKERVNACFDTLDEANKFLEECVKGYKFKIIKEVEIPC